MPKNKNVSELGDHLGYWLRFVSNHVSQGFQLKVEALGVTVAEWVVLRVLFEQENGDAKGGASPSFVAKELGMTRGAISKLVDRLVAKRLARCRTEKGDRRYQSLSLSPAGRKLVPQLAALADRNDAEYFGHLARDERAALEAMLKEIVRRRELSGVPVN